MKAASKSPALTAAIGYVIFFALLFLPFPLDGALPGNCDTWLNGLALPNLMLNQIEAAFTGEEVGTPLYPETQIFGFGESAPGTSAVFMLFKVLTRDDIVAYYFFVVTLLSLDALGVFLLARFYVRGPLAAGFAGLAFSASNYILGNIDSPHTSFFFVAFLCLYFCKRFLATGARRDLLLAALLGAVQVYFSAYVFLFQSLTAVGLLAAHSLRARKRAFGTLSLGGLVFVAAAAPFFGFYARAESRANFTNPWDSTFLAEAHSLEPSDLLRTLENNILYPFDRVIVADDIAWRTQRMLDKGVLQLENLTADDSLTVLGSLSSPDDIKYFVYTRRCAFLGFVLYGLAVIGLVADRRYRWELIILYVTALFVSFGPMIAVGDSLVANVTFPAYRWLDLAGHLRVPCRAFSFSVLAVVLAAAVGLERLGAWPALSETRRRTVIALLAVAVLIENVPMPLKSFEGRRFATPETSVREFFKGKRRQVLLDLPSRPGGALFRDSQDLFEWNREIIYMNRQTYHRQNIVNGVHGYFPRTRLQVQKLVDELPEREALAGLREFGVDYVVYHRALELPWEVGLYEKLVDSEMLVELFSSPDVTIFGLKSPVDEAEE